MTPNIDALAKEPLLFTHAFSMAGVCAPSRAGLITGVPQHVTGLQHIRAASFSTKYQGVPPSWVKGYPELLRQNGYFTYVDVKTDYQFSNGPTDMGPFTLWNAHGSYFNDDDLKVPSAWRNLNLQGKPFFLNINPHITHESALFQGNTLPALAKKIADRWSNIRFQYKTPTIDPGALTISLYWKDTPETRQELALFYKNINIMEQQVSNIIRHLKDDGLWDNTVLIFAADNGDGLPRHKHEGYDIGTHVPLIIHVPEKYKPAGWKGNGQQENRLVSFEDLAPTILGFTGTDAPYWMKGINLSADNAPRRKRVFSTRGCQEKYSPLFILRQR